MSPCKREAPGVLGPLLADKSDADEECFSDSTHRHVPDDRAKTRFWLIRFLYVVAFLFYTLSLCFLVQRATIRVPELLPRTQLLSRSDVMLAACLLKRSHME